MKTWIQAAKAGGGWRFFLAGFFLTVSDHWDRVCVPDQRRGRLGDKTVLIIDSLHQYLPFYTDMHNKLVEGRIAVVFLLGGLGYNFWSTYAYYLASPLNFLMVLIPTANVCDFMDLMILLKDRHCAAAALPGICTDGMRSGRYLSGCIRRDVCPEQFRDRVLFQPDVAGQRGDASADAVRHRAALWTGRADGHFRHCRCFTDCGATITSDLCCALFACLYYLVRWISAEQITWGTASGGARSRFAWYALTGRRYGVTGAASGVHGTVLVGVDAGQYKFPTVIKFYTSLSGHAEKPHGISGAGEYLRYTGRAECVLRCGDGPAGAFCTCLTGRVRLRERIAHYGLCAFLLLSFSLNILNYIWHGFHIQNGLPNRFAFLYIALLLCMAYDAIGHVRSYLAAGAVFRMARTGGICRILLSASGCGTGAGAVDSTTSPSG